MKLGFILALLVLPGIAMAADRTSASSVRVGTNRASQVGARMPSTVSSVNQTATLGATTAPTVPTLTANIGAVSTDQTGGNETTSDTTTGGTTPTAATSQSCRDAYRACMDEFCLLDESEGNRCACSSNINQSKSLIQEIQQIQEEADLLYTEGVEREQLGAQARLVFGESEEAQKVHVSLELVFQNGLAWAVKRRPVWVMITILATGCMQWRPNFVKIGWRHVAKMRKWKRYCIRA